MAKEKKEKGFSLTREIEINVTADELWKLVGDGFADVYIWASTVDHSSGSGSADFEGAVCSERSCDLNASGFDKISEKLTKYDIETKNLAYEVNSGMPSFITYASNDWQVVDLGNGKSKLIMNGNFQMKGLMGTMMKGMMKKKLTKTLDQVLVDAKVYAETGQVSEAKQKRVNKLNKKNMAA